MKSLVIGILFTLVPGLVCAQERQIEASYFMMFNFSEKEVTDPLGVVTLPPLELTHVVEINIPSVRMSSVIVDWGTDEAHWLFRRTFPVAYPDSTQPGHGVGLLPRHGRRSRHPQGAQGLGGTALVLQRPGRVRRPHHPAGHRRPGHRHRAGNPARQVHCRVE
jgi:hypothetical protein